MIKQFQQDGTYRIASDETADAILKAEIIRINRAPARSVRGNVLATNEFNLTLRVRYSLVERGTEKPWPSRLKWTAQRAFSLAPILLPTNGQALPLAAEELAIRLVSQLSEGW